MRLEGWRRKLGSRALGAIFRGVAFCSQRWISGVDDLAMRSEWMGSEDRAASPMHRRCGSSVARFASRRRRRCTASASPMRRRCVAD
eukprot:3438156-Pyramimonas_sp.AAC.1